MDIDATRVVEPPIDIKTPVAEDAGTRRRGDAEKKKRITRPAAKVRKVKRAK